MSENEILKTDNTDDTAKTKTRARKTFGVTDAVIIIIAFIVAAGGFMYFRQIRHEGTTAIVAKNNFEMYRIDLKSVDKPYDLTVDREHNIVIHVESDGVSVVSSDCKDKTCINTGKISRDGEAIVCLPNACTVYIDSDKSAKVDAVLR